MKTRRLLSTLVAILFLVGASACGADGDSDDANTATTSTTEKRTEVTEAQLSAALLTVDDLPSGFAKTSDDDDDDDDDDLQATDPACQDALDTLDASSNDSDDVAKAEATFEREDVQQVQHQVKAVADAGKRLERVASTLEEKCGNRIEFTSADVDDGVLEVESGDKHGDGTFYARMSFGSETDGTKLEVTAYLVYLANAEVGSTITMLSVDVPSMDVDADEPTLADAEALAAAAQKRYEAAFS